MFFFFLIFVSRQQKKVHQYRILPDSGGQLYIQAEEGVQERKFPDLRHLVKEYLSRGERNGLVCAIRFPVNSQKQPDEGDSGMLYSRIAESRQPTVEAKLLLAGLK